MRNLKKVLSLALALVMMLGMMVVGASAAEYTDAANIDADYKAAVDVTGAIKVILGRDGGNFDPKGTLNRAEGAAIIYRMITGGIEKDPEPVPTGFVDVDGTSFSWASGYIAACAQQNILSGVGDNRFDPAGKLTGYAFGKMLLVALGYDAGSQGYTGAGWEGNVFRDAYGRGINVTGVNMAAELTREQAAQMSLQTLTATMVDQTPGVSVNGVVIPGSKATDRVGSSSKNYDSNTSGDSKMQFCELYFPSLTLTNGTADAFGRATKVWKNGVKEITSIPAPAFMTYTSNMNTTAGKNQIKADLAGYLTGATAVTITENGTPSGDSLNISSSVDTLAEKTGNGKVVEVYVDDNKVSSVVTTEYRIAKIESKSTVSNTIRLSTGTVVTDKNDNKDYYDTLDAMEKGDYVIVALKSGKILELSEPEVASGAYTKKSGSKYTVGGTEYEASSANSIGDALKNVTGGNFDLYLDAYGYVLTAVPQAGAAKTDAFILNTSRDGTPKVGYTHSAQLLMTDGTVEWVEVSKYDNKNLSTDNAASTAFSGNSTYKDKFTKFVVNDDGLYELDAVATSNHKGYVANIDPANPSVTPSGSTAVTANSKTVFLVKQADGSYKAYTGIKNAPKISGNDAGDTLIDSGLAKVVIIGKANKEVNAEAKYVYFYNSTATSIDKVGSKTVYTYKAILDGVDTTVETVIDNMSDKLGLYANYSVDGDGYISGLASDDKMNLDATITASKLGKAGNIGVKYDGQALTLKVTNNILHVTAKAKEDIVTATSATAASQEQTNAFIDKYAADNFTVYRVIEGSAGKMEILDAETETLSVGDTVIITMNSDGEAAVAYVMGNTTPPATKDPSDLAGKGTVVIDDDTNVTTGNVALVASDAVTVAANKTLTINGDLSLDGAAVVTLGTGSKLVVTGGLTLTSGSITGGEVTVTGMTTIAGTSQTIADGVTLKANGGLTISGTGATIAGTVETTTLTSVATTVTGTVTASGAATLSGDVTGTGTLTVASFSDDATSADHAKTKTVGVTGATTVAVLEAVGNKGVADNKLVVGEDSSDEISNSNVWFSAAGTANTTAGIPITGKVTQGSYTATTCHYDSSSTADGNAITWLKDAE